MANICFTEYKIYGNETDLRVLHSLISEIEDNSLSKGTPFEVNQMLKALGYESKIDRYRGDICQNSLALKNDELCFCVASNWSRSIEIEETIRKRFNDSLSVFFLEEELGCNIFNTNDTTGTIFPECVIVDIYDEGMEYYTVTESIKVLNRLLNKNFHSYDEASEWVESHNDNISLHKAEVITA